MRRPEPGTITVICGSMFAGKTEELIRRARRVLYALNTLQVFKHALDDRYDARMVVAHHGMSYEAQPVADVASLRAAIAPSTDVVLIDEAQFFSEEIVDLVVELADAGVDVVLAGLDQDFRRRPFGPMPALLAIADEVHKLRALCVRCGRPASHTQRIVDGRPAHADDPVLLIGVSETYEARCRRCYRLRGGRRAGKRG